MGQAVLRCRRTAALLALCLTANVPCPVAAEQADPVQRGTSSAAARPLPFDIPAQQLGAALEAYGVISGFQVIYDAALAKGRQSSDVRGALAPDVALRRLLAGTGLVPRYMAQDGVVLELDPAASEAHSVLRSAVIRYYGRIQAGLRQAFCGDARPSIVPHRIAIGLWIAPSGLIARSALLDTTGDVDGDAALEAALQRIQIGEPPPAGFAQPVIMTVLPDMQNDCRTLQRQRQRVER
ncbi:hypothetical protein RPB_2211 [Rhodopseudomonas palustris HaA2]|uniref:Secretin/TonB short N-terminal domain-containing protein n=1 Tax=Rhodopseudomonas palustris (strain HaA2) TaxID=316058 RepID=Q2IXZ4_RHOP2|nr:STN domain-containing protein [Rhodopseudomonas palustris]ABD06916.1 hypothetical protein RPB_2211 [Rhodopseudomonas palustris HaA2]